MNSSSNQKRARDENSVVPQPAPPPKLFWKTFLEKMAIAVRLLGKEIHRLKLRQLDLPAADLRLGKEVYALPVSRPQPELIAQLDTLAERITSLRKREGERAATFAGKAKNTAQAFGRVIQTGWLKFRFRRVARQLGSSVRQEGGSNLYVAETEACTRIAQNIGSLDAAIETLRAKTHPWARRPLLLASSLLLLLVASATVAEMNNRRTPASALSEHHLRLMFTQAERDFEENERQRAEASRREAQRTEERIAAAQRSYMEESARKRAEEATLAAERAAADRAKEEQEAKLRVAEEEKRKEAERIAAAQKKAERAAQEKAAREQKEHEQAERDRIASEARRRKDERARIEQAEVELQAQARQRAAEEKKKEEDRVAAEEAAKKTAAAEKVRLEQLERVKAYREMVKQDLLCNARINVVHSFAKDMPAPGGWCAGKDGDLYGATFDRPFPPQAFKINTHGDFATILTWKDTGKVVRPDRDSAMVQGDDGNFYGTTKDGGIDFGTVYQLVPGKEIRLLHQFGWREGHHPQGTLIKGKDGNFYGVTRTGGAGDSGTIFKVTSEGALTTLHSFAPHTAEGSLPEGGLIQASDGTFHGTTSTGGTHGGQLKDSQGRLGPKEKEGTLNDGTIFRMSPDGAVTTIYQLNERVWNASNQYEGAHPKSPLIEGKVGDFYGTTSKGGKNGGGTVFRVTAKGEFKVLYDFKDEGILIGSMIKAPDGTLYGVTKGKAATPNLGTIFCITPTGDVRIIYVFKNRGDIRATGWFQVYDPCLPSSGVVIGDDGKLYGLTARGGASDHGSLYRCDPSDSFVALQEDNLKAEKLVAHLSPPERRRSGEEIAKEFVSKVFERAAEADAANHAHSRSVVSQSGGGKMLCPKCGGSKKMLQHDYNSSYNPYRSGTLPSALFENGRNSTSVVNCDRCAGAGVVEAR